MKTIIASFFLLIPLLNIYPQIYQSEESSITIKGDKEPPVIQILFPTMKMNQNYISEAPEVNLVGRVIDQSKILTVLVNGKMVELNSNGIFTIPVFLELGLNSFSIYSIDINENYIESDIRINFVPKELPFHEMIQRQSIFYGLIIGIDEYQDEMIIDLDNPVRDATKIAGILTEYYSFSEENVKLLKNPTRAEILDALDELSGRITEKDNLLIFYAGHGRWDPESTVGFWLPSDARADRKAEWFRNSTLVDYLKEVKSRHTLLIADACFSGSIFKTRMVDTKASMAVQKLYDLPSRKAMTSGALQEVPDKSAFIEYLAKRLMDNDEKYFSSEQLFSSIRSAVLNNSPNIPQFGEIKDVGDEGGDFIFVRKK